MPTVAKLYLVYNGCTPCLRRESECIGPVGLVKELNCILHSAFSSSPSPLLSLSSPLSFYPPPISLPPPPHPSTHTLISTYPSLPPWICNPHLLTEVTRPRLLESASMCCQVDPPSPIIICKYVLSCWPALACYNSASMCCHADPPSPIIICKYVLSCWPAFACYNLQVCVVMLTGLAYRNLQACVVKLTRPRLSKSAGLCC